MEKRLIYPSAHATSRKGIPISKATSGLLICGIVAGPLFLSLSIAQALLREGFDVARQPISFLSLGTMGWMQRSNFVLTGLLVFALAVGIRRVLTSRAGRVGVPLAIAGLGAGLMVAGVFPPDPGFGYPTGTPEGPPSVLTYTSTLHAVGFTLSFVGFAVADVLLMRAALARRQWGMVAFSFVTGAAALVLAMAPGDEGIALRNLFAAGFLWAWVTTTSLRFLVAGRRRQYSIDEEFNHARGTDARAE